MKYSLAVLLIAGLFACSPQNDNSLKVYATGSATVMPETATFHFAFEERGKSVRELKKKIDARSAELIKLSKALGVEAKDISSAEVTIYPDYNYRDGKLMGYRMSRDVKIVLQQIDKYPQVMQSAVNAGITNIRDLELQSKKPDELKDAALLKAIERARQKAELMAQKAGLRLGKILSLNELPDNRSPLLRGLAMAKAKVEQNSFEPGTMSMSKSVEVTFAVH